VDGMSNENKLKKILDYEIARAINKYNSAVFILQGGTTTDALSKFGNNGPRLPSESLRRMCAKADYKNYKSLERVARWCTPEFAEKHGESMSEPTLQILRKNKHLFIGRPKL
jgi:hypothetical protein